MAAVSKEILHVQNMLIVDELNVAFMQNVTPVTIPKKQQVWITSQIVQLIVSHNDPLSAELSERSQMKPPFSGICMSNETGLYL